MKKTTLRLSRSTILAIFMAFTSVMLFAQPANDDCSGATTVAVGATCANILVSYDGTQTDSGIPVPNCGGYEADLWYQFVMPASGSVSVTTSPSDGSVSDGVMALYKDTCASLFYLGCASDNNGAFETLSLVETPGTTIYIRLWQDTRFFPQAIGNHNLCVVELAAPAPAANDDCNTAEALAIGTDCTIVLGSNFDATDSAIADPTIPDPACAAIYSGGDVWYTVTVPTSGDLAVETSESDGTIIDGGLALYSGNCAPSSLALLACDDDSGVGRFERIELFGRTPGETIYVRVWSFDDIKGTFNICAVELNPLSTHEVLASEFKIYPNPANTNVSIALKNANDRFTVGIYDVQGKLVLTAENKSQLNTSALTGGLYFVKVNTVSGETTQKLIIK